MTDSNKMFMYRKWGCVKGNNFGLFSSGNKLSSVLPLLHPDCHSLPEPNLLPGQLSHGTVGIHGGKVRWLSMAFESVSCFNVQLVTSLLSCCHVWRYISLLSSDHIQGEILFSDLLWLPSVGEFYPGAARLPSTVLRSATGIPDLWALEADIHGNNRQVRVGSACLLFCSLKSY